MSFDNTLSTSSEFHNLLRSSGFIGKLLRIISLPMSRSKPCIPSFPLVSTVIRHRSIRTFIPISAECPQPFNISVTSFLCIPIKKNATSRNISLFLSSLRPSKLILSFFCTSLFGIVLSLFKTLLHSYTFLLNRCDPITSRASGNLSQYEATSLASEANSSFGHGS
ncbi:hypothetical protein AAHE18_02G130500 [Arachis hypogaea]